MEPSICHQNLVINDGMRLYWSISIPISREFDLVAALSVVELVRLFPLNQIKSFCTIVEKGTDRKTGWWLSYNQSDFRIEKGGTQAICLNLHSLSIECMCFTTLIVRTVRVCTSPKCRTRYAINT